MNEMTERDDLATVTPTRITALNRGRSHVLDTIFLARYRRKALIQDIEAETRRVLLCYVSENPPVERADVLHLEALLQRVEPGSNVTVLLNSLGGDADAAEKLLHMLTEVVAPSGDLEIVVPNEAKSAATIIALGADRLTMSDTSELGPIDPQFPFPEEDTIRWYPVAAWLAAYEAAKRRCEEHPDIPAFAAGFQRFSPALVEQLRLMESRTRQLAERIATRHGWNSTLVAARLMDTDRFPSHGQMIDWRTAREIGLKHVQHKPRTDPLWSRYWQLYVALRAVAGDRKKVFESRHVTRLG